jgi:hypothetical protein
VCIFAVKPPDLDPVQFQPTDLAWAPNGNLWVISIGASASLRCMVEYDGQTGEFLGYIVDPVPGPTLPPGAPGACLSFGGPDGNIYLPAFTGVFGDKIYEYDRVTQANLGVVCSPSPPMHTPRRARFTSNGNYLIGGQTGGSPVPTIREYDGTTFELTRDFAVEAGTSRYGFLETADGCCYLASRSNGQHVDKFDITTAEHLGEFIPRSPCLDMGPQLPAPDCDPIDPCYWEAMKGPTDMAYGPNGHLYVCANDTPLELAESWHKRGYCQFAVGAVHEFDPVTGDQIQVIGKQGIFEFPWLASAPERSYKPEAIEFKPMPGDFGSSGAAFGGDWFGGLFFREQRPVVGQRVDEEELDAEEMLLERALGDGPNLTQVHEVVAQLAFGEPIGREAEMPDQLPHNPDVRRLCPLRQAGELHVLNHAFSKFGHRNILQ